MLNAKLVVVGGGDARVSEVQLHLPTTIGRSREAKLKLPHPLVSRKHCEVFEREGQLFVRDLGSLNGTYVDNHKIEAEQALQPNQLLTLGTVTFRAIYEAANVEGTLSQDQHPAASAPNQSSSKRAEIFAEREPIHLPLSPQSEIDTEADRAASDTDSNLPALGKIDISEIGESSLQSAATDSSVFVNDGSTPSNGSVSLSEISKLPSAPPQLSFVGGIQAEPGDAASVIPRGSSLPKIQTGGIVSPSDPSGKRRPR